MVEIVNEFCKKVKFWFIQGNTTVINIYYKCSLKIA